MSNISKFSIGFSFVLMVFQAVQQNLIVFLQRFENENAGFYGLITTYTLFMLSSLVAPIIIARIGAKKAILIASLVLVGYVLSISHLDETLFYLASVIMGPTWALMWCGQFTFLNSKDEDSVNNAGFFFMVYAVINGVGIAMITVFLMFFSYQETFLAYAGLAILGISYLLKVKQDKAVNNRIRCNGILPSAHPTVVRYGSSIFVAYIIYGIAISAIPLEIEQLFGAQYIGFISAPFFAVQALVSRLVAKLSISYGKLRVLFLGNAVTIFSYALLSQVAHGHTLVWAIVVLSFGFALLNPITTSFVGDLKSSAVPVEKVSGTFVFMRVAGIVVGLLLPLLAPSYAYIIAAVITVLPVALLWPYLPVAVEETRASIAFDIRVANSRCG